MRRLLLAALALTALVGACRALTPPPPQMPGTDPERGKQLLGTYGCIGCHAIPGVRGADATVGPPLTRFALRTYIGGHVPNTPDNLVAWIMNPKQFIPDTAMPNLGVPEQDARDMAGYLYRLR